MSKHTIYTVTITEDADGTYTITSPDDGYTSNGYDWEGALKLAVSLALTDEDIDEWHVGNMTTHMRDILNDVESAQPGAVVSIWGSRDGNEPLSITISNE